MNDQFINSYLSAGQTVISNLVLRNYHKIGMSSSELMVYFQLKSYIDQGIPAPDISKIANNLGTDTNQVYELMHKMIQGNLMTHETKIDSNGKQTDYYDFAILAKKMVNLIDQENTDSSEESKKSDREQVFNKIEVEFGRPLSPIEFETIAKWMDEDHYSAQIIEMSLQEAVLNQAWNLKYMDRILRSWEKQHITTPQQVDKLRQDHLDQQAPISKSSGHNKIKKGPNIPLFKITDN
ncbi:DnaD domain protein [Paucilactobacillus suebicus]|uniref:Primosome component related protein n=1 Tax=Paucilactobacillus suebicus DSM 5007 = KCTC 3549 TaxID=1423807 RepID=A0A0R1VV84_9LACO|nr:DnaD domain protein [Paucilactobacillus suebicus]KRM09426.1 primosome component related protein [Paucilactobacillus suebicus DSM 5007 = KCTC 3549]